MDPYLFIIIASGAIIVSHLFNVLAWRTNMPSVLMLIVVGLALHQVIAFYGWGKPGPLVTQVLNVLGISGLIMIVLEAALELKLSVIRRELIIRSFIVALLTLGGTVAAITFIIQHFVDADLFRCLVYAVPLSIVSSAIVLPSVARLQRDRRDFMVFEATFSDIMGIMIFYFLVDDHAGSSPLRIGLNLTGNVLMTVVVSVLASFLLLWVFQRIRSKVKFFLLIAVLMLLYALGKKMNLSSLLIILIFGMMVSNQGLMFKGWVARFTGSSTMLNIERELHLVTAETAFVVRTFFFLVFGLTIDVKRLLDQDVLIIGTAVTAAIYLVKALVVGALRTPGWRTVTLVAPRGLITILLAYNIPDHLRIPDRDGSVLLMVILATSIIMMIGLMANGRHHDLSAVEPGLQGGKELGEPAARTEV
jgi:Kef-type K+ transport system membrane component KefB